MNYREFLSKAISNPADAFREALDHEELTSLAFLLVLGRGADPPSLKSNFSAVLKKFGQAPPISELLLSIFGHHADFEHLLGDASNCLKTMSNHLSLTPEQIERTCDLVRDDGLDQSHRMRLLVWVWKQDAKTAEAVSAQVLAHEALAVGLISQQSIIVLANATNGRSELHAYSKRAIEEDQLDAALYVLNHLANVSHKDDEFIAETLSAVAAAGGEVDGKLKELWPKLTIPQIEHIVRFMAAEDHEEWIANQMLPSLVTVRAADIANSLNADWWPEVCQQALAVYAWENQDDRLYALAAQRLHETDNSLAQQLVRERLAERCASTGSTAASRMPRLGARTMIRLALTEKIATNDPHLAATLSCLSLDSLREELPLVGWKSLRRADHLGGIASHLSSEALSTVLQLAVELGSDVALAVISGAASALDGGADSVLRIVGDDTELLAAVCEKSTVCATKTLERWRSEAYMPAFRSLARSGVTEDRFQDIASIARSYEAIKTEDRVEVLRAFGARPERVAALIDVLKDRSNQRHGPTPTDLVAALSLLAEHLEQGLSPAEVLEELNSICRAYRRSSAVRIEAYRALAFASPTVEVVELVLERARGEAPSARAEAQAALAAIGKKLDLLAGDHQHSDRGDALEQLSKIDVSAAVGHARELLISADDPRERTLAAEILGAAGSDDDAELLEHQSTDEPDPEVRESIMRSVRRLRIGDSAAAHERIGELIGVADRDAWLQIDPAELYGGWVQAIVEGLNRVARAEAKNEVGTAIDQLDELAHALLFRALETAPSEAGISAKIQAKVSTNTIGYGAVLGMQEPNQRWKWMRHFGSLHELRTEHIAERGSLIPPAEADSDDLATAKSLFRRGAGPCAAILVESLGRTSESPPLREDQT